MSSYIEIFFVFNGSIKLGRRKKCVEFLTTTTTNAIDDQLEKREKFCLC